jgi:hypothetical protein
MCITGATTADTHNCRSLRLSRLGVERIGRAITAPWPPRRPPAASLPCPRTSVPRACAGCEPECGTLGAGDRGGNRPVLNPQDLLGRRNVHDHGLIKRLAEEPERHLFETAALVMARTHRCRRFRMCPPAKHSGRRWRPHSGRQRQPTIDQQRADADLPWAQRGRPRRRGSWGTCAWAADRRGSACAECWPRQ